MEANQQVALMSHPLLVTSGLSSAGSLLVHFTSLSTSYWVLEKGKKGIIHSGLWRYCSDPECTMYQFHLLAPHVHVTRGLLLLAWFCGLLSLLGICISFEHIELYEISVIKVAAIASFSGGFFIMISMSVFTAVYRSYPSYTKHLLMFGYSYILGWASLPMYAMTGILLMLTHKAIVSELSEPLASLAASRTTSG